MEGALQRQLRGGTTAIVVLFALDRIIKYVIMTGGGYDFGRVMHNKGLAFSVDVPGAVLWLLISASGVVLVRMMYTALRKNEGRSIVLLGGIFAGAVSNVLDRILWGGVIDYIFIGTWLPVFNIADLLIVGCAVLWILVMV